MPPLKKIGYALLVVLGYLIAFDIIGVVVSLVFDVAPLKGKSTALFYSIWFVLGVFCGFLGFDRAARVIAGPGENDWSTRPEGSRTGWFVIITTAGLFAAVCALSRHFLWNYSVIPSYFVPDNEALTFVFAVAVLSSMIIANTALLPTKRA